MFCEIKSPSLKPERIKWIDCAKGMAMLLVIIGHTVPVSNNLIRSTIFSFHMPLFFVLSCLTYRPSKDWNEWAVKTRHVAKHLLLPMLLMWCIRLIVDLITTITDTATPLTYQFLVKKIATLIFASGNTAHVFGYGIPGIGVTWFLAALFTGKTVLDALYVCVKGARIRAFAIVVLCVLGIVLGQFVGLPLSMEIALSVLPFLAGGVYWQKKMPKQGSFRRMCIAFGIWGASFAVIELTVKQYLELAAHRYPLFPLCYIAAFAATICFAELARLWAEQIWMKPVVVLGRFSLYMLCIHGIDSFWKVLWNIGDSVFLHTVLRCFWDIVLFAVVLAVKRLIKGVGHENK